MFNSHHIQQLIAGSGLAVALLVSTGGPASGRPIDRGSEAITVVATPSRDMRSPDARDAGGFYRPIAPEPTPAPAVPTTAAAVDWPMILVATGGYLLAVIVAACALAALRGGRRRRLAA